MATTKQLVRKNGIPVKRFWRERIKRNDTHYPTTYPTYWSSSHSSNPDDINKVWSVTDEKAPRTLEDAIGMAATLIESPDDPQSHAVIYELRAVARLGTEFDWKTHEEEKRRDQQVKMGGRFRLLSTTASGLDGSGM